MGAAAYNRGSAAISAQIDAEKRPVEFEIMDNLNALAKFKDAGTPFGPVRLVEGNGGFWIECPATGFGWWYTTLREAVRRWRVTIVGFDNGVWIAEPMPRIHSLLR